MTERVCIQCKEKNKKKANNGKALHLQWVKQINICMYIFLFSIDTFVKRSREIGGRPYSSNHWKFAED